MVWWGGEVIVNVLRSTQGLSPNDSALVLLIPHHSLVLDLR